MLMRADRRLEPLRSIDREIASRRARFRASYPRSHRLRFTDWSDDWGILPALSPQVVEWLDDNAPGWALMRFGVPALGFEDPAHAVCFKMVWGGVQ